jgi:hypothetical protein
LVFTFFKVTHFEVQIFRLQFHVFVVKMWIIFETTLHVASCLASKTKGIKQHAARATQIVLLS